jgi:hypothetical protein
VAEFAYLEGGQMLNVKFAACSVPSIKDWRRLARAEESPSSL